MNRRSQKIIPASEAQVLRALRCKRRLSMRAVTDVVGVSNSTIAHIETGRMNPPRGDLLSKLLVVYGAIKRKRFTERVRKWKSKVTPRQDLLILLERANSAQIVMLLNVTKSILNRGGYAWIPS